VKTRPPSSKSGGFSLLEAIIALALLLILFTVVTQVLGTSLRNQTHLTLQADVQTRLKRAMALITEDLRNSSFGLLGSEPYPSGPQSISMVSMAGTAVYPVVQLSSPQSNDFPNQDNFTVIGSPNWSCSASSPCLLTLLSPASSEATLLPVDNAGPTGNGELAVHSGYANTLCYSSQMFVFRSQAVGYEYIPSAQVLLRTVGFSPTSSNTTVAAFGVSGFQISYIDANGVAHSQPPSTQQPYALARLAITLTMREQGAFGTTVTRQLTGFVEMSQQQKNSLGQATFVPAQASSGSKGSCQ
jgi:Tfp pilus assembly protein PilW